MRVEIPSFWETLEKRCNERKDSYLRMKIGGDFTELAALEASYQKTCHVSYIKQYTYTKKQNDRALYDNAFINFDIEYFNVNKMWKSSKHANFVTEISGAMAFIRVTPRIIA